MERTNDCPRPGASRERARPDGDPLPEDLTAEPITNDGGRVSIREVPGIGIQMDGDVLAEYRFDSQ